MIRVKNVLKMAESSTVCNLEHGKPRNWNKGIYVWLEMVTI